MTTTEVRVSPVAVLHAMHERVSHAGCWDDLAAVVDDLDAAFAVGTLSSRAAERLAELCRTRSREVPDHA